MKTVNHHVQQIWFLAQYLEGRSETEMYGELLHIEDQCKQARRLIDEKQPLSQKQKQTEKQNAGV